MVSNKEIKRRLETLRSGKKNNSPIRSKPDVVENVEPKSDIQLKPEMNNLLSYADSLFYEKKYESALEHYKRYIKKVRSGKSVCFFIGECYFAIGDYKNVILAYDRFLRHVRYMATVNPDFHDENKDKIFEIA